MGSELLKFILILMLSLSEVMSYSQTSDCKSCLSSNVTTNKFCLPYDDSAFGYCCDVNSATDQCSQSNRYLCTDKVSTSSMKLYLCPFSSSKCYTTSSTQDFDQNINSRIIYVGDQAQQIGGTTLDYGKDDVCGWKIIANTQFIQDKYIRITINSLYQVNCYINTGKNVQNANGETSCAANTQYDFDADQSIFIVVQGTTQGAALRFSYQLIDRLSITQISIIYSVSIFVFAILAGVLIVLVVRFVVQKVISKHQTQWQQMALEMNQIVHNADKQKQQQHLGPVEDYIDEIKKDNLMYPIQSARGKYNQVYPLDNYPTNARLRHDNATPQFNLY